MKIHINYTNEYMEKYIDEAQDYLKKHVTITKSLINFDATNKVFYEDITFWDKNILRKRTSIRSIVISALGRVFGQKADVYGLIVPKRDTFKAGVPLRDRGLYDPTLNVLEVYASKSRRKICGFPETTSHIIHEILHALSDYHGKKDILHFYLERNNNYDGYLEYVEL